MTTKSTTTGDSLQRYLPWGLFAAFFLIYPLIFNSDTQRENGFYIILFALYATGWNVLGGLTGQISLGHVMFFGIGAYSSAVFWQQGWSPWLGMLFGVLLSLPVAWLVGMPVFKLKGHYFTIATIAVGEVILTLVKNSGTFVIPSKFDRLGITFDLPFDDIEIELLGTRGINMAPDADRVGFTSMYWGDIFPNFYFLAFGFLVAALILTEVIRRSRMGYYLQAVRNNQEAASSLGIPITKYKQYAFLVSAGIVSITGTLWTQNVQLAEPINSFGLPISINIAIVAVIGGTFSLWGPVVGAIIFMILERWMRQKYGADFPGLNLVINGIILMVLAAFEPRGVLGFVDRIRSIIKPKKDLIEAKGEVNDAVAS